MWREVRVIWCDMGWCGRWVQVMEYRSVEREGVRKRVRSHTHIHMLHLLCTSLTLSSKYCTHERSNFNPSYFWSYDTCNTIEWKDF